MDFIQRHGFMMNNNTFIVNSAIIHLKCITGMCVLVKRHTTGYSSLLIVIPSTQYLCQPVEYHTSGLHCIIHLLKAHLINILKCFPVIV